ncbi:MAG: hypothetical protein V4760_10880 [Bdellovibrionota bacterium]
MKTPIGLLVAAMAFATSANAADIFVRPARGSDLTRAQQTEVTDLVSKAVHSMPEHNLVSVEGDADFVLQPSIVSRGEQQLLRIEKQKDGQVMAMSEEPINSVNASNDRAMAVTETALQEDTYVGQSSESDDGGTQSATTTSASEASNEVVGASPIMGQREFPGFFQLAVGPSFGLGMDTDAVMTNVMAAYNYTFSDGVIGKGFVDGNFGSGSDSARFINVGVGGEFYPSQNLISFGKPYVAADAGYAFTRDNDDNTEDGIAVGAGVGFKFAAAALNMDVNLHYTLLTEQIDSTNPSVFGVRLAVNF